MYCMGGGGWEGERRERERERERERVKKAWVFATLTAYLLR